MAMAAGAVHDGGYPQDLLSRHRRLKISHLRLKGALKTSVKKTLRSHIQESGTMKEFTDKAMSTVAAYMLSQMCNEALSLAVEKLTGYAAVNELISRAIYAVLVLFLVPAGLWALRNFELDKRTSLAGDQIQLLKLSLPMFFAWGWKDFVAAIINLMQDDGRHELWPEAVVACGLTVVIAFAEAFPCYQRSVTAASGGDSFWARMLSMLGSLGLAVGFAWNQVWSWAPTKLQGEVSAPIFKLMIQIIYFVLIGGLITTAHLRWHLLCGSDAGNAEEGDSHRQRSDEDDASVDDDLEEQNSTLVELFQYEEDFLWQSGKIAMDSLMFVYAWAQLDTLNVFYFRYINGCDTAKKCSYQLNIIFAGSLTFVFARLATMLKSEKRYTAWNQAATALTNKAMSLNVGWAWSAYSFVAMANAVEASECPALLTHVIFACFAWFLISVMHRKFEIERRAWDRHVAEETVNHGLGVSGTASSA